jgi:hypothetical protein
LQPQDNSPVKIEANGFPIADSPVRQRVDATRNMQEGGSVEDYPNIDLKRKTNILTKGDRSIYEHSILGSMPAKFVGGESGSRYYIGKGTSRSKDLAHDKARMNLNEKMFSTPADSIPAAMIGDYFPKYMQEEAPMEEAPVEAPKKKGRLRGLLGFQEGGEVDFKEHMMYDKNDKGYLAKTYEDHLRMKKMGYSHKGMQEGGEVRSPTMGDIGALLRLEELYKSGDPKVESGASAFTPEGGYSKDYLAEETGIPMESFDIDTLYYKNPADYQFKFLKDGEEMGTKTGRMRPRKAEYLKQNAIAEEALRKKIGDDNYGDVMFDMYKKDYKGLEDKISSKYYDMSPEEQEDYDMNKISSRFRSFNFQEGGKVGKYEKALQRAEMMGDAGYALPESLSAPAEEMSNMRSAEDLYGMYMRMGPQMVKDKMSNMESRALDSLLQQKMNNMDRPAVPQYGMGGMIDEYNMGGYVKKYQDGGEVEPQQVGIPPVDKFQQMAETWEDTGRGVESARAEQLRMAKFPADNYSGKEVQKNMNALAPYYKSFGRLKTPLQERNDFLYNRLNVNPNNLPSSLQGLKGSALLQRLGNEGI